MVKNRFLLFRFIVADREESAHCRGGKPFNAKRLTIGLWMA